MKLPHPIALLLALGVVGAPVSAAIRFASHPPLRPLPSPSTRPLPDNGRVVYVDPARGSDQNPGTREQPWQTLAHAVTRLGPGDTLSLCGGVYYESVVLTAQGTPDRPITIRSHPGELAVLDAGIREFFERPADAWEPVPQGAPGEFHSRQTYAAGGDGGNFGDSLVPLRKYGNFPDLRAPRELEGAPREERAVYVGPGSRRDPDTGHIHIRLSHTTHPELGNDNYRGEVDPRKLPLVIPFADHSVRLAWARHIRLQDLVLRGAQECTLKITGSAAIELDHVTIYPATYGLTVTDTSGLRVQHSAFRGFAAPWHPRSSGADVDCFCPLGLVRLESGSDFEFAYNEFTDHHDGLQIKNVQNLSFHHNYLEHFNDDVLDWNIDHKASDAAWGTHRIFQNVIVRGLTVFSIHSGVPVDPAASTGIYAYRNIIDKRRGTYGAPPSRRESRPNEDTSKRGFVRPGRLFGDHGSPIWPAIHFYHNTVLDGGSMYVSQYGFGTGTKGLKGTKRRVFNNIFVYRPFDGVAKTAGKFLLPPEAPGANLEVGGNLFWRTDGVRAASSAIDARIDDVSAFADRMKAFRPDPHATDRFADPRFRGWNARLTVTDVALLPESPAIDRGIAIPAAWPDPLKQSDGGAPDIDALPLDGKPWGVGIEGRIPVVPLEARLAF